MSSYDRDAKTPEVGSEWHWYADGTHEPIKVREVKWNGEEWWVLTSGPRGLYWNDLDVFWGGVRTRAGRHREGLI